MENLGIDIDFTRIGQLDHFFRTLYTFATQTLTKSSIPPCSGKFLINKVIQSIPHHGKCRNGHKFYTNRPIISKIEYFTFLPLEAAVHQFSTCLLISFDPITRFQSFFFKVFVITRAIYLNCWKACKVSQFYAAIKKTQNWGKMGLEKGVGAEPFQNFQKLSLNSWYISVVKDSSFVILAFFNLNKSVLFFILTINN